MDCEFQPDERAEKIIKAGNRKVVEGRIGEKRKGKLPNSKDEKIARSLANPANFGEVVLGFRFAPKQRRALEMCERPGNICIACANEGGKALALDTAIPTPGGWSTIGSLKIGDEVYDSDGKICNVIFTTGVMPDHKCYRVNFSCGESIVADAEHLWETDFCEPLKRGAHSNVKSKVVFTTERLKETLRYSRGNKWGGSAHSIAVCPPIDGRSNDIEFDPYLLGVWLGDGTTGHPTITCHRDEVDHFSKAFQLKGFKTNWRQDKRNKSCCIHFSIGFKGVRSLAKLALSGMGVLNRKHIPSKYLRASIEDRRALFAGLMDTDGCTDKRGHCEFCSTSPTLSLQTWELALSLGYKAAFRTGRAMCNGKDCGKKFRICFKTDSSKSPFKLLRKTDKLPTPRNSERPSTIRFVESIEEVESVPVRCIQVDSPTECFLASRSFIKTHNTSRIIPTLVLWHQWLWPAGKCKVTSGAYLQIEDQVWPAILRHKDKFPKWHWLETPYFESKDPATGETGFFRGFTTNHPGRAEGDHEELPNSPLMFIVDEAKTAQEWLKKVLMGRVRATRTILMSSHGFAEGWFYETMRLAPTEVVEA